MTEILYKAASGHLSAYFAQLLSAPTYADDPADTQDIQIQKTALQLQVLHEIKASVGTPGFHAIEADCTIRIRKIESELIWTAIKENNQSDIHSLAGEHEAILGLFRNFDTIDSDIGILTQHLNRLKGRSSDNPQDGM